MNQKLKTRIVRWLTIVSSTACVCSLTFWTVPAESFGQLPKPIGSGVHQSEHNWRVDQANVMQAVPNLAHNTSSTTVVHAAGHARPPIVSPDQATPHKRSSMLAPINVQEGVVQDSQVTPAKAQWPVANQNNGYRVAQANGTRNMPVQIGPMDVGRTISPGPQTRGYGPAANPLPPIVEGNVVTTSSQEPTSVVIPPSSTIVPPDVPAPPVNGGSAPQTNYFQQQPEINPVYTPGAVTGTCGSCGGGGCASCGGTASNATNGACGSCGPNGCYDEQTVKDRFACAGSVACARRYFIFDGLYFTRSDSDFGATEENDLPNYDFDAGIRLTIGRREDVSNGDEISYMGTTALERGNINTSATNSLNALFNPGGRFTFADLSGFYQARRQIEASSVLFHSVELNRCTWAWDVVKFYRGIRGFYVQDDYLLLSDGNFGFGRFRTSTQNYLLGPHLGSEIFYDVGYRLSSSFFYKVGGFLNFSHLDTQIANNGISLADRSRDKTTWSWNLELGINLHYQIAPKVRLRAGWNVLWLWELASATGNGNIPRRVTQFTGTSIDSSDSMFFTGGNIGLEIYR